MNVFILKTKYNEAAVGDLGIGVMPRYAVMADGSPVFRTGLATKSYRFFHDINTAKNFVESKYESNIDQIYDEYRYDKMVNLVCKA